MRNLNSIPISALRTVEAIARLGTLARAAEEIGVTPGALSQRLAKAELTLGKQLFIRTSTGLRPNEVCIAVLPRLTRAMSDMESALRDIYSTDQTALIVTVAPLFASRWLIWRIRKFNEQNPSITIRIEPRLEVVDLERSEADVGIRVGEAPELGIGATKLLDQRVFPVCSPDLAEKIKSPNDLFKMPIIRENNDLYGWESWLSKYGLSKSQIGGGPTYGDASLCLDAAMTGQGVFMAWETIACDALERGQISAPFRHRAATGAAYWFATSQFSSRKSSVLLFQSWLQDELNTSIKSWQLVNS